MYPTLESRGDILKMLDEMTAVRRLILERCASLTAAQLNDPVYPGTWSLFKNLAHLAWAEAYMLGWIRKRPKPLLPEEWPAEPPADLAAIRTALDEAHAGSIASLNTNPEAGLPARRPYGRQQTAHSPGGGVSH